MGWHIWRGVPVAGLAKTSGDLGAMHTRTGISIWKQCLNKWRCFRMRNLWKDDYDKWVVEAGNWPMKQIPKARRHEPTVLEYFTDKERQ
jgi:hypothetical protein